MISAIQKNDPNALILIMADHGGFVGLEYTGQIYEKTEDPLVIRSIFSSILAIHWPNGEAPVFDGKFKSTVNTFRILFAHLGNEPAYLDHLQEDGSYVVIKDGAPNGIYQYINGAGEIVFKKQE